RGYIQSWNFTVERQLPMDLVGTVAYVGTQTVRQGADLNINAAAPGTGQARRPFFAPFGRTANTPLNTGFLSANYHALQTSINRRFTRGLLIKGAYTYSKAIDWTDDDGWAGLAFNYGPELKKNRAVAGFDRTHVFQVGWVYDLPFGKGRHF